MEFEDQIELIKEYIEDTVGFLDEFDGLLLKLEQQVGQGPDPALLEEILGILHTFKGNSGMMGFSSLQKYAHQLEDLFKALQSGALELDAGLAECCLGNASILRNAVAKVSADCPEDPLLDEELEALDRLISLRIRAAASVPEMPMAAPRESIRPAAHQTNVLKVDFERLDHLLNLMGELVIYRTRLGRINSQFKEVHGEKGLVLDLSDASEQIGKVTTELHEAIMKVRMVPIKQVLMRFPRLVRDLARTKEKEISLQLEGEETELDKTVIDVIGEPLMHLIRNAIDHGIEKPEVREEQGKPRQGTIMIRAGQESSHIIITVEDDGAGIDEERLREKAEQSGLLKPDEGEAGDLTDLIFISGMSTADEVTEVSGRGLGMDVVKRSLARISGTVEAESERHVGTRFTIKLPLTLAIISVLMVEVSGEQYAVPLSSVVESMKVKDEEIHLVNHREVTNVRGRILPLVRLSRLFGIQRPPNGKSNYVVIVRSAAGEMGIIVDALLGQQEIVIKALDDYIGNSVGIAGATILGDGKVVLIVDVFELMDKVRRQGEREEKRETRHAE
jgi:two-component system, chemotaxis family, sensor kinase CheA